MAEDYTATIRIRRPAKVTTDERGRTVWTGEVETAELELVSTAELKEILAASDDESRTAIERVAHGDTDGVLARDPTTGLFAVVSDAELKAALEEKGGAATGPLETLQPASGADEDLSLVSTQVLRKMLKTSEPKAAAAARPAKSAPAPQPKRDEGGGFDPYNSG